MPRSSAVLAVLAALVSWAFSGCAPQCDGVEVNGRCEKACSDDACVQGAKCVNNACRLACSSSGDCLAGQQCGKTTTDYGSVGTYCIGGDALPTSGFDGDHCRASADCALRYGYHCVSSACTLTCETHAQCGSRGACSGSAEDAEGHAVVVCEKDSFPRAAGQYGTSCTNGDECASPFVCVGAGPGDLDAYCTTSCHADTDCPTGLFCETTTDSSGRSKSLCRYREFCNECESDADCRGKANQLCAKDRSGAKICTVRCVPTQGSCPWGNAAECGVWDGDLGFETCGHRFGSCTGAGNGCEPCIQDADCPRGFCARAQFSGERFCVDQTETCSCPSGTASVCFGNGCPNTPKPGDLPMTCLGGTSYEGDPSFGLCYGANGDPGTRASRQSCWPTL